MSIDRLRFQIGPNGEGLMSIGYDAPRPAEAGWVVRIPGRGVTFYPAERFTADLTDPTGAVFRGPGGVSRYDWGHTAITGLIPDGPDLLRIYEIDRPS